MLCGTVPFKAPNLEELHKLILKGEFTYPIEMTSDAKDLVNRLIRLNPYSRITMPQILSHNWLKETNEEDEEEEEEEDNNEEVENITG